MYDDLSMRVQDRVDPIDEFLLNAIEAGLSKLKRKESIDVVALCI